MRLAYVAGIAFVMALAAQAILWRFDALTDETLWVQRLQQTVTDWRDGAFEQKDYSAHPGTVVLVLAALPHSLGMSEVASLKITMAVLVSAAVSIVASVVFRLWPYWPAWVGAVGMLALHPLFIHASPTNAVTGAMVAAVFWIALGADRWRQLPWPWTITLGISLGLGLASHFPLMVLMAVPAVAWVGWRCGWRRIGTAIGIAGMMFVLFDPLLWYQPIIHLSLVLKRIEVHAFEEGAARLRAYDVPLFGSVALLAWLSAAVISFRKIPTPLSQPTLAFLVGLTLVVSVVMLLLASQSIRYFFPLILFWESVLPMWLGQLAERTRRPALLAALLTIFLISGQAWLLGMALI